MNTGQMMITIGALMLLGVVILRVNTGFVSTSNTLYESKFGLLAVSLATSVIEDATGKAFDEQTDTSSVTSTAALTNAGSFGPDVGETSRALYDDFDDYHGLNYTDSTMRSAYYHIVCNVDYINPLNPEVASGVKTFHKKLTVTVTSISMEDTVKMSSINSYFYFR